MLNKMTLFSRKVRNKELKLFSIYIFTFKTEKMIDRKLLCKETANYLIEHNCTTLFCNGYNLDDKNPFMVICFACTQSYDEKEARRIYSLWETREYRHEVYRELFRRKIVISSDQKKTMYIYVPKSTWNRFEGDNITVNSEGRRSFLVEFCDYIGELMREFKINCWPKIKYNYLTKINSHKTPRYYWSGTYSCKNESCPIRFSMNTVDGPITKFDDILVEINWQGECFHEIYKRITYCSRGIRNTTAQEIATSGLGNVIANKIVENHKNNQAASKHYKNFFLSNNS
jgi:hypothetical protein